MKNMKAIKRCVCILAALLVLPTYAHAITNLNKEFYTEYYRDTFDSKLGYMSDNESDTGNAFYVDIDNSAGNPAPSRKIAAEKRMIARTPAAGSASEIHIYTVEADFRVSELADVSRSLLAIYDNNGNINCAELKMQGNYLYLDCFGGDGNKKTLPVGSFEANSWFNIAYSVHTQTKEIKLYFNRARVHTDGKIYVNPAAPDVRRILSIDKRNVSGNVWIDNLLIYDDLMSSQINFDDQYYPTVELNLPESDTSRRTLKWEGMDWAPDTKIATLRVSRVSSRYGTQYRTYFAYLDDSYVTDFKGQIAFDISETAEAVISLPGFTAKGLPLVWSSNNEAVIDSRGNVTRQAADTTVTLTAECMGLSAQFQVTVKGYGSETGLYIIGREVSFEPAGKKYRLRLYNGGDVQKAWLMFASYDTDGRLKKVSKSEKTLARGENEISAPVTDSGGAYYKGFLWSADGVMPLDKSITELTGNPNHVLLAIGGGNIHAASRYSNGFAGENDSVLFTSPGSDKWYSANGKKPAELLALWKLGNMRGEALGEAVGIMDFTDEESSFDEAYIAAMLERIRELRAAGVIFDGIVFAPPEVLLERNEGDIGLLFANRLADMAYRIREAAGSADIPLALCEPMKEKQGYVPAIESCATQLGNAYIVNAEGIDSTDGIRVSESGAIQLGEKLYQALYGN